MKLLFCGFYGEGNTDNCFLIPLIERILQNLLPQLDIFVTDIHVDKSSRQDETMERVARESRGYALVIFHLDADAPNTQKAYRQRFEPGYAKVQRSKGALNKNIVPVIPVRMTEAWMLVDFEAFRKAVGTELSQQRSGFPQHARDVESVPNPKEVFKNAVQNARPSRRKSIPLADVYRPLALHIRLERLEQVPAYQEFLARLTDTLRRLKYIID